ncbi:polymer-forming cytoskeletal protein [Effusibacillus lacus]|uniref:Bactofilin n=1 Tax=Effusibacillus lacus TaxID=1348429 RepID=A0A292YM01_9BACL|nr:polymer-forming cytoskeletal protein [Effusibacillus lacus]TCS70789.1 cytoskeletal protein CcmA (bactofilin family) [Effusibacillus lacus]GAX89414.1 hypothetical protein EFBL_1032 [Effusibacillus lacus]
MENLARGNRNLKIYGTGTAAGGVYEKVSVNGEAEIAGDLDCTHLKINGNCTFHGNVKAKLFRIAGNADVDGSISGDEIKILGALTVNGDCNAESFVAKGGFTIDGLLNAGKIDISPYGPCEVKEIGGETIHVRSRFRLFVGYNHLSSETIEGDDIHLEYTKAEVVRGNRVIIGPGCEIGLVEYKETFHQAKGVKVHESKKI